MYRQTHHALINWSKQRTQYTRRAREMMRVSTTHKYHWLNFIASFSLWSRTYPEINIIDLLTYSLWLSHRYFFGYNTTVNTDDYNYLLTWLNRHFPDSDFSSLGTHPTQIIIDLMSTPANKRRFFPLFSHLFAFWATFLFPTCPLYDRIFGGDQDQDEGPEQDQEPDQEPDQDQD